MLSFREFVDFVTEGSFVANPFQPWCPVKNHDPETVYDIALERVEKIKKKFESILKRASGGTAKVLIDIKSKKSFMSKVERGKNPCMIHDLLRAAILCKTEEAVHDAVVQLKKTQQWHEIEGKERGTNPYGYYGSYHLKIVVDGIICEVQVMTQRLWTYKEWGHEIYNQSREKQAKTGYIDPNAVSLSKRIFDKGNHMPYIPSAKPYYKMAYAEGFIPEAYGPLVTKAQQYAIQAHGDQKYGDFAYSKHLKHVVNVLHRFHRDTPVLLAAAWLHDTVEDTKTSLKDLGSFPKEVLDIVHAVTDEAGNSRAEKKAATYPKIRRLPSATVLKLADRIANVEVGGKIDNYRKEHASFKKALYVPGVADDMWNYLDQMLALPMAA